MKKGLICMLALSLILIPVFSGAMVSNIEKEVQLSQSKTSYSAVPVHDELRDKLQAKGKKIKDHLPAHLINGPHLANPLDTIDTKPAPSELNAITIYFKFPENPDDPNDIVPGTDIYERIDKEYFQDMLFGTEYNPYEMEQFKDYAEYEGIEVPTDRTLHNYYKEVSYGKVNVTGEVVEVTMPQPHAYYAIGKEYGEVQNDYGDYTMALILKDAVEEAAKQVNFEDYAVDGEVPVVFLIHPGTGAEWNLDPSVIWSHQWDYGEAYNYLQYAETGDESWLNAPATEKIEVDGVYVNAYSIEPEVGGDITGYFGEIEGPFAPQPGVYCHEFGHVLGLPDQYDYGYDSEGTGRYSLMSGGSWTRYPNNVAYSGNTPVHMDVWSKLYLGLEEELITLEEGQQTITLEPSAVEGKFVKLVVPGSDGSEYFLIENRQQVGYDLGFSRVSEDVHGLEIYHIDENVLSRNFWRPNEAQNWIQSRMQNVKPDPETGETHYGFALVQADNRWDLEKNKNSADGGDLFKTGDEFTPRSTPNSGSYYFMSNGDGEKPNNTDIFVKDIIENEDGSITFTAGFEEK